MTDSDSEPAGVLDASPARPLTTQLLLDLVNETLDPGYAAAAQRRGPSPARRWFDRPAVIIGCLLIGFVLIVAYIHTHRGAPQAAKVHDRLVTRVRVAEHDANGLAGQAQALQNSLSKLRDQAGLGTLASEVDRAELAAGQSPVVGPGFQVILRQPAASPTSTPSARAGTTPITAANILTDRDVRSVVNELWADGAEAISVNNVRLTPTSAIRFAGEVVLVDFQPVSSPYTIRAIGNSDDLATGFAASAVASRYQTLAGVDGIGFTFATRGSVSLPASAASTLRYAEPLTASSGAEPTSAPPSGSGK